MFADRSMQTTLEELSRWLREWLDRSYCRVMVVDDRVEHLSVAAAAAVVRRDGFDWEPYWQGTTAIDKLPPTFLGREPVVLTGAAISDAPLVPPVKSSPLKELLVVPVVAQDRMVGILDFGECRGRTENGPTSDGHPRRRPTLSGNDDPARLLDLARHAARLAAQVLESERKRQLLVRLEGTLQELQSETSTRWRELAHLGAELLNAALGAVYVFDPNIDEFVLRGKHANDNCADFLVQRCRRGEGFIGALGVRAWKREVVLGAGWPGGDGALSPFTTGATLKAAVATTIRDVNLEAVLMVADDAERRVFTDIDLDALDRFARHASRAHRRAHSSPENQQLAQFRLLNQIIDYMQKAKDLDRILHALLTGITAGYGLRFNRAALFLYNEARATLDGKMAIGSLTPEENDVDWRHHRQAGPQDFLDYLEFASSGPLPMSRFRALVNELSLPLDDGGVLRSALDSQKWLISGHDMARLPARLRDVFDPDTSAEILLVRLMTTHPLGVVIVDNKFNKEPIGPDAIESLTTFASTAAIAIESFQVRDESELADNAARALIDLQETHNVTAVMQRIVHEAIMLCNGQLGVFWPYYEDSQQFAPQPIAVNLNAKSNRDMTERAPRPTGIARRILEREYVSIANVESDPILDHERRRLLIEAGIQSFQGIALKVGNERLGVLYVNYTAPRRFEDEIDRRRLARFAMHAARTLKSARLSLRVQEAQRTARVLANLAPLTYLEETIQDVATHTKDLLECDAVILHVYNAYTDAFEGRPHRVSNPVEGLVECRDDQDDTTLARWVMSQRDPIAVEDLEQYPAFVPRFARHSLQSCLALPLTAFNLGLQTGALFADFHDKRRFTAEQRTQARLFARQAAIAIGNALKLREQDVVVAATRSLLNTESLQETLNRVAQAAAKALSTPGTSSVVSEVVLKEGLDLVVRGVNGDDRGVIGTCRGTSSHASFAAERGETVVSTYQTETRFNVDDETSRGFKSGISARMTANDEFIGVLEVRSKQLREFGNSHSFLISQLAAHAAMAIKSDQRSADLRRRRGHLQALRDAEELVESIRPNHAGKVPRAGVSRNDVLNDLLRITIECYRKHSFDPKPTTCGTLLLRREDMLVLESVYPSELKPLFEKAIGPRWSLLQLPVGITGRAVLEKRPQFELNLSRQHPAFVPVIETTRSEIAAPIFSCGKVVGVLDVESDSPRGFDQDDLKVLVTLAGFVTIALAHHGTEHIRRAAHDLSKSMTLSYDATRKLLEGPGELERTALVGRLTQQLADLEFHQRLTDDIEAAAKIVNEEPLQEQWTSLADLVAAVVGRFEKAASEKAIRLDSDLPDGDRIMLRLDKDRTRQVITNIIANAIKYTQFKGNVAVRVTHMATADRVLVAVIDNGVHRPPKDELERLFEPYYRASSVLARHPPGDRDDQVGQGLGLSIAKTLVGLHGGHIWAEHNDRGGLTVAFDLPTRSEAAFVELRSPDSDDATHAAVALDLPTNGGGDPP